jgi:hypothetical protein
MSSCSYELCVLRRNGHDIKEVSVFHKCCNFQQTGYNYSNVFTNYCLISYLSSPLDIDHSFTVYEQMFGSFVKHSYQKTSNVRIIL